MPEQITDAQLDEWQGLADAATEGPWEASRDYDLGGEQVSDEAILIGTPCGLPDDIGSTYRGHDAAFIAAARTIVPALIAEVREGRALLKPARDYISALQDAVDAEKARAETAEARVQQAERACRTLGKIVEDQCRDIATITRSEDLVAEDGDADWGAIWERGHDMADRLEKAESRVEAVRAQMLDWEKRHRMGDRSKINLFWAANAIRAALGPAALDGGE